MFVKDFIFYPIAKLNPISQHFAAAPKSPKGDFPHCKKSPLGDAICSKAKSSIIMFCLAIAVLFNM